MGTSFATHSIASADALVKVGPDVPLELLGPLACGLATGAGAVLNEARSRLGDSVLIVGVGAVGLAAIMAARNSGVTRIIAADVQAGSAHAGSHILIALGSAAKLDEFPTRQGRNLTRGLTGGVS